MRRSLDGACSCSTGVTRRKYSPAWPCFAPIEEPGAQRELDEIAAHPAFQNELQALTLALNQADLAFEPARLRAVERLGRIWSDKAAAHTDPCSGMLPRSR